MARYALRVAFGSVVVVALARLAVPIECNADEVYRFVGEDGTVHYSSAPPHPGAKPAELPDITKGDYRVAKPKAESCEGHGGINCDAGPDKDGSVVCFDGFKSAVGRFRFHCSSAQIQITEVSEKQQDGSFKVFARNNSAVQANKLHIEYKGGTKKDVKLTGPEMIEPYSVAEYILGVEGLVAEATPKASDFEVRCENCP